MGICRTITAAQGPGVDVRHRSRELDVLSYCRGFPPFILMVDPDDAAQAAIGEARVGVNDRLERDGSG